MSFLHQKSCECVKTELDLFSLPPTQTSIESGKWVQYKPISTLTDDAPIEFVVPGNGDEYTDLSQKMIQLTASIVKSNGTAVTTDEEAKTVGPVNNWLHSLFSQVDMFMNQKLVTPQNNTYAYRAYVETLMNYGYDARKSHLTCSLWYTDDGIDMNDCAEENEGLKARRELTNKSREIDMLGHLHVDICNQNKFMLNGVELRFKFIRSKDAFSIMASAGEFKVHIVDISLWIRRCKISPTALLAHSKTLQTGTAKYPITRVELKTFTLPSGIRNKTLDNMFLGQVPKRIIVGMVTNAAYNGDFKKNPYNFEHFKTNFFCLYVDGEQVPSKPLQPHFEKSKDKYVMAYHSMFSGSGVHFSDAGTVISREDFGQGYCLMAFDLTPDLSASDTTHWNLVRNGSVRMELGFDDALPETVNCLVYAEFDNVIEIDRQRNVIVDFGG